MLAWLAATDVPDMRDDRSLTGATAEEEKSTAAESWPSYKPETIVEADEDAAESSEPGAEKKPEDKPGSTESGSPILPRRRRFPALMTMAAAIMLLSWLTLLLQTLSGKAPDRWSVELAEKLLAELSQNGFTLLGPRMDALIEGVAQWLEVSSGWRDITWRDIAEPFMSAVSLIRFLFAGPTLSDAVRVICSLLMAASWLVWHLARAWRVTRRYEPDFTWIHVGLFLGLADVLLLTADLVCPVQSHWYRTLILMKTVLCFQAPAVLTAWLVTQICRALPGCRDRREAFRVLRYAVAVFVFLTAAVLLMHIP